MRLTFRPWSLSARSVVTLTWFCTGKEFTPIRYLQMRVLAGQHSTSTPGFIPTTVVESDNGL